MINPKRKRKKKVFVFNLEIYENRGDKVFKISGADFEQFNIVAEELFNKFR